tara:strand:- start:728 stop:1972 length:1245 start_codon:yes stop_codon:yes gene_type:complete
VPDDPHASSAWPANVSFGQLIDNFVPAARRDKFVLNLGANDGARHDPSFPLIVERNYGGILVEGDPSFKKRLYANVRPFNASGRLQISWGFASANSIGPRLKSLGCPNDPDALKIDVDGLDAALLEGIVLSGISPKTIAIEVAPDIPPPVQLSQLYHDGFKFEFERKHLRGWLGASADALYTLLGSHGYALVAIELGTREHMRCDRGGTVCSLKSTCTHCEHNMWFVRSDLLRAAAGVEPPSWPQFVSAYWKQTFAFNTYQNNQKVDKHHVPKKPPFAKQSFQHDGVYTRDAEDRSYTPECYILSEYAYHPAQRGEHFTKPECPMLTLRDQALSSASGAGGKISGWRSWARHSLWLAKPANAAKAFAFAKATAEALKAPACRPDEACPYNVSTTVHRTAGTRDHSFALPARDEQ